MKNKKFDLITPQEICNKCISSTSMDTCLFRHCPLWLGNFRTKEEIDKIIKENNIKLRNEF